MIGYPRDARLRGASHRALIVSIMVVAGLSLAQILVAPIKTRLLHESSIDTSAWTLSYTGIDGRRIVTSLPAPVSSKSFIEGRTAGPFQVAMTVPHCVAYKYYRFWVGAYGSDSTDRQPRQWKVFTRGQTGNWHEADAESSIGSYGNDRWYAFPLQTAGDSVCAVRLDIMDVVRGDIFRLYRFELYEPSPLEAAARRFAAKFRLPWR